MSKLGFHISRISNVTMSTLIMFLCGILVLVQAASIQTKVELQDTFTEDGVNDQERDLSILNIGESHKIIAGAPAVKGHFPWQASLYIQDRRGTWFCGGCLIHTQWVVTAGHCTRGAKRIAVRLGSLNKKKGGLLFKINATKTTVFTHSNFNSYHMYHDIGLIKLPQNVQKTDYIKPIAIIPIIRAYNLLSISGWGLKCTTYDPHAQDSSFESFFAPYHVHVKCDRSQTLNYANVSAISNSVCEKSFGPLIRQNLCAMAKYDGRQSLCLGDSGSPLVQLGLQNYLVGILSFGHSKGCEAKRPFGFTRVNSYCEWLNSKIGENQVCKITL